MMEDTAAPGTETEVEPPLPPRAGRTPRAPRGTRASERVKAHAQSAPAAAAAPPGQRLTRSRRRTEDKFFIDRSLIPVGMSYEWKRESTFNAPDPQHIQFLQENHWREVPADRHPGLLTRHDGMVLMERPKYLTDEAIIEDFGIAQSQVQSVRPDRLRAQTPSDQFTRDHPSVRRVEQLNVERRETSIVPPTVK